jgi:hypothetical protein
MNKKSVLVIEPDDERWDKLKKALPKALPHCSFVFEPTMRDAFDTASLGYDMVLLCTGDHDDADSMRRNVDWLTDHCAGARVIIYDRFGKKLHQHETCAVVRRKWWRWRHAIIKTLRRYLPAPQESEGDAEERSQH